VIALVLRLTLEVALACHCARWVATEHGARCIEPLDHPRCELVDGWHPVSFGVDTCSRGRCE
jgi:hypothetical protein